MEDVDVNTLHDLLFEAGDIEKSITTGQVDG